MRPIKIWIHGLSGRMGSALQNRIACDQNHQFSLIGGSTHENTLLVEDNPWENTDLVIDVSSANGNSTLLEAALKITKKPAFLICTTGISTKTLENWKNLASEAAIMQASNTSLGIFLCMKVSTLIAPICTKQDFDCEIVETHHRYKLDQPSGTALFLAENIAASANLNISIARQKPRQPGELGVHSIRGGAIFGEHSIRFISENEEITISHRALNRSLFADGALLLAQWLSKQSAGFYQLENLTIENIMKIVNQKL